jgi:hypothetical protein
MTTALTLLMTALQLKVALLGLPAEYQSTVERIMPVVENAISTANAEIAKGEQGVNTPVVTEQILPVVATRSIMDTMEDKTISISLSDAGDTNGNKHYAIRISYKENGVEKRDVPITVSTNDTEGLFEWRDLTIPAELNKGLSNGPIIITSKKVGEEIVGYVVYRSKNPNTTITATVGDITKSIDF